MDLSTCTKDPSTSIEGTKDQPRWAQAQAPTTQALAQGPYPSFNGFDIDAKILGSILMDQGTSAKGLELRHGRSER